MSDSFLDHLPAHEQKRLKKKMSAAAYEKLRESVKGPEDLEKELKRADKMAALHFALESEPKLQERMRSSVEQEIKDHLEETVEHSKNLSPAVLSALTKGNFTVAVAPHPHSHHDVLVVVPEGNIQEKVVIAKSPSDRLMSQMLDESDQ